MPTRLALPATPDSSSLGAGHSETSDPYRQGIHPAHLFVVEPRRILQVIDEHFKSIVTPEELVARNIRGHSENALLNRPVRIASQLLFDQGIAQRSVHVGDSERLSELCEHRRI